VIFIALKIVTSVEAVNPDLQLDSVPMSFCLHVCFFLAGHSSQMRIGPVASLISISERDRPFDGRLSRHEDAFQLCQKHLQQGSLQDFGVSQVSLSVLNSLCWLVGRSA